MWKKEIKEPELLWLNTFQSAHKSISLIVIWLLIDDVLWRLSIFHAFDCCYCMCSCLSLLQLHTKKKHWNYDKRNVLAIAIAITFASYASVHLIDVYMCIARNVLFNV